MTAQRPEAPRSIEPDDPRIAAARPHTLDDAELARLELAMMGAWPAPFCVRVSETLDVETTLALRNSEGVIFALFTATEVEGARLGSDRVAGNLSIVRWPRHPDFPEWRIAPSELRARIRADARITAYFVDGGIDAALGARLAATIESDADLLLVFVSVGAVRAGDLAHHLRVKSLEAAIRGISANRGSARLVLVPDGDDRSLPRLAIRRAIASCYGATRLFVDRIDGAEANEPGIVLAALPKAATPIGDWGEIDALLARANPPRSRRGFTVWFTGLSQAGKSTIATRLSRLLLDHGRGSTLLDGDVVRTHLSKGLGFSREDRDTNIRRLGFVAGEITRHGGVALVAAISPYRAIRAENRARIGDYVEVFVNAPVETCEARDQKGQYAKARRGDIKGFTGVDDPYEPPLPGDGAVIECRTDRESPDESARRVFDHLVTLGYVDPADRIA